MLAPVLYGSTTLSAKLSEEHRFEGFQKRVCRKMIGPKIDEVTGVSFFIVAPCILKIH
jgi:hypothetical protein